MTGLLAAVRAVLARLRPARGRHAEVPGPPDDDTLVFPKVAEADDDVPPHWITRLDLKPLRPRPYVQPGDEEAAVRLRWEFPDYDIGVTGGAWRAFRIAASPAVLLQAGTADELAALIAADRAGELP